MVQEDLPVWEVRFGDTGTLADEKRSEYSIQDMRCSGDRFFDNTVTFVKLDANLELPSIFAEYEFDMSFLFKTTIKDAVLMQNVGRKSGHFFELRIRSKYLSFLICFCSHTEGDGDSLRLENSEVYYV